MVSSHEHLPAESIFENKIHTDYLHLVLVSQLSVYVNLHVVEWTFILHSLLPEPGMRFSQQRIFFIHVGEIKLAYQFGKEMNRRLHVDNFVRYCLCACKDIKPFC